MSKPIPFWAIFALCCILVNVLVVEAKSITTYQDMQKRAESRQHMRSQKRSSTNTTGFRYNTSAAAPYIVESLPDITDDPGEMYSGVISIDDSDPTAQMFFVFEPTIGEPVDEITIWLNGGPGCSSLEGFLQENGRFIWSWGMRNAEENKYSWVNLTNVLWVEYPLGVGYSANAVPAATTEEEIAQDFLTFFRKFESIFGISNHKIYVTGESYAGRYVPYIADAMLLQNDTTHLNLSGILIYDPSIGQGPYQQAAAIAVPYVWERAYFFNFNDTYMAQLADAHYACGYADYLRRYLTFPPSGEQPAIAADATNSTECDLWNQIYKEAYRPNPCFNPYSINLQCPLLSDPLGFPTDLQYLYAGFGDVYFNRSDVKKAMHAPSDVTWSECTGLAFNLTNTTCTFGDCSLDSIQHVLPRVIEATNRVFIGGADFDFELPVDGILLAIQNMTWNGKMGFQAKPSTPIYLALPDLQYQETFVESGFEGYDEPGQGYMGTQHYERGLLWGQTKACGHMQPQLQPRSSYRHLQWLLGYIEML